MWGTSQKRIGEATKADGQKWCETRSPEKAESNQRQIRTKRPEGRIYFRELATMAFPIKTEANLAFFARVDARTARRWLSDEGNEPPADILGIVLAEIMRRYGQRD